MTYDLHSLSLPVLHGRALQSFAGLLDNRAARSALLPNLMANGGLPDLRTLQLDAAPRFAPLARAAATAVAEATTPVDWDALQTAVAEKLVERQRPAVFFDLLDGRD